MSKKQIFLLLILVVITTGGVFAETWYDSYAPGIDQGFMFVNAGAGASFFTITDSGIPIIASLDFKLPVGLPITIGATVMFQSYEWDSVYGSETELETATDVAFGGRGMYHFNFLQNLDAYAGIYLGASIETTTTDDESMTRFDYGPIFGARYFFTKYIGGYIELGVSRLQLANIGLTLKF